MNQQQILLDQLKQIEEKQFQILQSFKKLIQKYDQLNLQEQELLIKGVNRVSKFYKSNDFLYTNQPQGPTFTSAQINIILNNIGNSINQKLYEALKKELYKGIAYPPLEVQSIDFDVLSDSHIDNRYYGFIKDGQPYGLGVLIQADNEILFGYFYENQFQYGTQIILKNSQVSVQSMDIMKLMKKKQAQVPLNQITNDIFQLIDKNLQNNPTFQMSFNKRIPQIKKVLTIDNIMKQLTTNEPIPIIHAVFYIGGLIEKIQNKRRLRLRHGYGGYINTNLQVIAIGVWDNDYFKWGVFMAIENTVEVFKTEQMEDHCQFYLQVDETPVGELNKIIEQEFK